MSFKNHNNNDRQPTNTTYSPVSFSNPEALDGSRLNISYFNKLLQVSIQKRNGTKNDYATYDTEYSIEINPVYGYNKGTSNHTELTMYKLNVSNTLVNSSDFSVNICTVTEYKEKIYTKKAGNQIMLIMDQEDLYIYKVTNQLLS